MTNDEERPDTNEQDRDGDPPGEDDGFSFGDSAGLQPADQAESAETASEPDPVDASDTGDGWTVPDVGVLDWFRRGGRDDDPATPYAFDTEGFDFGGWLAAGEATEDAPPPEAAASTEGETETETTPDEAVVVVDEAGGDGGDGPPSIVPSVPGAGTPPVKLAAVALFLASAIAVALTVTGAVPVLGPAQGLATVDAQGGEEPEPTVTPTAEPTPTQTEAPTATPTAAPTPTATAEPTPTVTATPTATTTATPTPTENGSDGGLTDPLFGDGDDE